MEDEVVIARFALHDLERIRAYIARDNPTTAQTFALRLLDGAGSLRTFPERGGFIAERPGARFVIVSPYLGVYRIVEQSRTVRVLRFWHGSRERVRMRL